MGMRLPTFSCTAVVALAFATTTVMIAQPAAAASLPFAPSSAWNAPLAADAPLAANSPALVAELQRQVTTYGTWINTRQYSTPVYTVPADQPRVPVTLDTYMPTLQQSFLSVPIPDNAAPAKGSDAHLTVWQPSTDSLWEFWLMRRATDGWHARWGGAMSGVSSNPGFFPAPFGATGSSLPLLGGLMRISELQAGRIDHALALAIPQAKKTEFVAPAQRTDGKLDSPDAIPEGTRLRIDPQLDLATLHLPAMALTMATAVQRYGMIVRDQSGSVTFYGEDSTPLAGTNPYTALYGGKYPDQLLAKFPWSHLQVVAPTAPAP
jgi:hypothetical protein